jgi:ATP-dependent HslUV protease subunit HslV
MSYADEPRSPFRGTTICAVKRDGVIAVAGDGQVTMGEHTIMKGTARKVRRIFSGKVVVGFAGSVADAFALSEKFEDKLTQYSGNLPRAAVELAQDWRMDKAMRRLEAMLLCADQENLMLVSGTGEVIEPDDGILAIGSVILEGCVAHLLSAHLLLFAVILHPLHHPGAHDVLVGHRRSLAVCLSDAHEQRQGTKQNLLHTRI